MAEAQDNMLSKKPLFIYDRDGTLQSLIGFAWALTRKEKKSDISLQEFKEQNFNEDRALLPEMAELVRYTATLGYNVLISGGDPKECCKNMLALQKYFQNWQFQGKDVAWGTSPEHFSKVSREVAKGLFDYFRSERIVVIGDSLDDYVLALHLSYFAKLYAKEHNQKQPEVIMILRNGPQKESTLDGVVPLITVESGAQMKQVIQNLFDNPKAPKVSALLAEQNRNPQH